MALQSRVIFRAAHAAGLLRWRIKDRKTHFLTDCVVAPHQLLQLFLRHVQLLAGLKVDGVDDAVGVDVLAVYMGADQHLAAVKVFCQPPRGFVGLPVFEPTAQQARGMSGAEYHTALKGQSWKLRLMNTIDACMKYAADKDAFVSLMASEGYQVRWESTRKHITYTTPDGLKCRDSKLHEEKYCKEAMEHEFRIRAEIVSARTQAAQLPADSAAGAGTTSRSTSHKSGLGANDEIHGCTVVPCRSADRYVGERQQADVAASHANAAGRSAEDGAASGADDRTGWETERELFFSAQNQTSQTASATCQYSGIDLSADGGGSTASALVGLGHRLEQLQPAEPVIPARHYTDRKALQKEREKKIALGHKADDHEDEVSYDWQQTM